MGIPQELILSTDGPGDELIGRGVIGGVVDGQDEIAVDGSDTGAVSHPLKFCRIVRRTQQAAFDTGREGLVDIASFPRPFYPASSVVNLQQRGDTVHAGDDILPWAVGRNRFLILGSQSLLRLDRIQRQVRIWVDKEENPGQKATEHSETNVFLLIPFLFGDERG